MPLLTLHRIEAEPVAKTSGTFRCLRAVRVSRRIARAPDPTIRRSVMEIAIKKPCCLAEVEWHHIFFPVFQTVPRPLRSDDVRSSCTWPNCDERSRGVIAALLSWSTIRGRDRSHTKTRARMISLRCSSGVLPPCRIGIDGRARGRHGQLAGAIGECLQPGLSSLLPACPAIAEASGIDPRRRIESTTPHLASQDRGSDVPTDAHALAKTTAEGIDHDRKRSPGYSRNSPISRLNKPRRRSGVVDHSGYKNLTRHKRHALWNSEVAVA